MNAAMTLRAQQNGGGGDVTVCASQEGLCCMDLVSFITYFIFYSNFS